MSINYQGQINPQYWLNMKAVLSEADINFSAGVESLYELIRASVLHKICMESETQAAAIESVYHAIDKRWKVAC